MFTFLSKKTSPKSKTWVKLASFYCKICISYRVQESEVFTTKLGTVQEEEMTTRFNVTVSEGAAGFQLVLKTMFKLMLILITIFKLIFTKMTHTRRSRERSFKPYGSWQFNVQFDFIADLITANTFWKLQ